MHALVATCARPHQCIHGPVDTVYQASLCTMHVPPVSKARFWTVEEWRRNSLGIWAGFYKIWHNCIMRSLVTNVMLCWLGGNIAQIKSLPRILSPWNTSWLLRTLLLFLAQHLCCVQLLHSSLTWLSLVLCQHGKEANNYNDKSLSHAAL